MIIGIDVSKLKIDVCCLLNGKKQSKLFKNDESGFNELFKWVKTLKAAEKPVFCMEATGCYHEALAEYIYDAGYKVSVVNPLLIKRFRESKMVRQKTDKSDASIIAEYYLQNEPLSWKPSPPEIKELRDINRHLDCLNGELRRWTNRLEKKHHNQKVKENIDKKIAELKKEIKEFKEIAKSLIKSLPTLAPKAELLDEIVGVGEMSTLTILSEIPDVANFANAEQYTAFVGITPSHYSSGTSVKGQSKISRYGNPRIRKSLYMAAIIVKNHNPHFTKWVKKLENKGKTPKIIIVAVMRKLLRIAYGMLKSNQQFDAKLAFGGDV